MAVDPQELLGRLERWLRMCDKRTALPWNLPDEYELILACREVIRASLPQQVDQQFRYLFCPIDGCSYRTGATSAADVQARRALAAHLTRKMHSLSSSEARVLADQAKCDVPASPSPQEPR